MSELETGNETGVSPEGSASPETDSPAQSQEAAPTQDVSVVQAPKEAPFHEHPRFKELISERNQEREERARLSQQIQQMQAALQKQSQPAQRSKQDQLLERLTSIDPEFAEFQKGIYDKLSVAEQTQRELQELRSQRESEQATNQFDKLCTDNKVEAKDKFLYEQMIANMATSTNAKISQLPNLFKQAHEQLSKYFDDRDRANRESYVADKTKDKRPATATGGIPASAAKAKGPMTSEDAKAAIVKAIRANQNI